METTEEQNIYNAFQKGRLKQKKEELNKLLQLFKFEFDNDVVDYVSLGRLKELVKQLQKEIGGEEKE